MGTQPDEPWTVRRVFEWMVGYLKSHGDEHPRLSTEWLVSAATGLSRVELYLEFDRPLSTGERAALRKGVKRRAAGEPLQYVTGEVAFRHIIVKTRPGVLIPRPETEMLVDLVFDELPSASRGGGRLRIFEPCTGSGCIACSLAREREDVDVVACDISPEAVALAKRNVAALDLESRVSVLECDLGECLDEAGVTGVDAIVSNPPYIPSDTIGELPDEVARFEPRLALDGGPDGLDLIRRIVQLASACLGPGGVLACEMYEKGGDEAVSLCRESGLVEARIVDDLAGRPRFLIARAPSAPAVAE